MKFSKIFLFSRWVLGIIFLFPTLAFAHLISIAAITPFPAQVAEGSRTTASYKVTNIASRVTLTPINQSQFTSKSGLSILSSTCGVPLLPGQFCTVTLQLQAPSSPQTISSALRERASPSADGVEYPIKIEVVAVPHYSITPSITSGSGTLTPSSSQVVTRGTDLTFTASPSSGYKIGLWTLDGDIVQSGGGSYALNNITANHAIGISFVPLASLIAAGKGDGAPLIVRSINEGSSWQAVDNSAISGMPSTGLIMASSCSGGVNGTCIATGQDTALNVPLLVVNTNVGGGGNWLIPSISSFTADGLFSVASCAGEQSGIRCFAAGRTQSSQQPILVASLDGGNNWSAKTISGLPAKSGIYGLGCTGNGANILCVAVGQNLTNSSPPQPPLLITSVGGGNTWNVFDNADIPTLPIDGAFYAASCTGTGGNNSVCTAVGQDYTGSQPPLIVTSTDGGSSWEVSNITGKPATGSFSAVSCTSSTSTPAVCAAVGEDDTGSFPPLLAVSTDGGITWAVKNIANVPSPAFLQTVSCTGSGASAICVAGGVDFSGSQPPLLVISTNGGATWQRQSISGAPTGFFNSVHCVGTGQTAICTAAGSDQANDLPLLAASFNGGTTWAFQTLDNPPSNGRYHAAAGSTR